MKKNDINIPKLHIDPDRLMRLDIDITLMSSNDAFFRRIVEFVLNKVERTEEGDILIILVDDNGVEYEMALKPDGYIKSLSKAKEYFLAIEEYETCDLIKQLILYLE